MPDTTLPPQPDTHPQALLIHASGILESVASSIREGFFDGNFSPGHEEEEEALNDMRETARALRSMAASQ